MTLTSALRVVVSSGVGTYNSAEGVPNKEQRILTVCPCHAADLATWATSC